SRVFTPRIPVRGILSSPCRRKTFSTASTHSRRVQSCSTSLRLSTSVGSARIWASNKIDNVLAGLCFDGRLAATENPGAGFPFQCDRAVFTQQPRAFAHPDDWGFILLEKLKNAFLLGFAHVGRVRVRVLEMRANLKRNQA